MLVFKGDNRSSMALEMNFSAVEKAEGLLE
jgi:hypothetical protein